MSSAAASKSAAETLNSRKAKTPGVRLSVSVPRLVGCALLIALGLMIAWLLVASETTREREAGCQHSSYRDPVTGQQVMRPCRAVLR